MKYLLTSILFCTTFLVNAQSPFSFGVHTGVSFSNLGITNFSTEDVFAGSTGFLIGGRVAYNLTGRSTFLIDVSYEGKGAEYSFGVISDPQTEASRTLRLNYLTIPVMYRYYIGKGSTRVYLNGGPYFGLLLGEDGTDNNVEDFGTGDVGFSMGLGMNFHVGGRQWIYVEGRGNFGVQEVSRIVSFNDGSIVNSSWNIIVGFTLN